MCTYPRTGTFCGCDCGHGKHRHDEIRGFVCCCHARMISRKHRSAATNAARTSVLMRTKPNAR
jgi:hypothetical protein